MDTNLLKQLNEVNLDEGELDTEMRNSVDVTIDSDNPDVVYDTEGKVEIPFDLDVEYRSYGIKDITPILSRQITIAYQDVTEEDFVDKEVVVDLSQLKIDYTSGQVYTVGSLSLHLDEQGVVDYEKSSIDFYFIDKS